jgi:protein phosphatase 1 regulatory subunit 11
MNEFWSGNELFFSSIGYNSSNGQQSRYLLTSIQLPLFLSENTEDPTLTVTEQPEQLVLRLKSNQPERRVTFTADTVDNEHLGRLKSNCCCIYTRPRQWDDPSTWEQDEHETEHCRGHTIPIEPLKKPEKE